MAALVVLATSRVPEGIRGALTQWYIEVLPGIFAGSVSRRVRDELWSILQGSLEAEAAYAAEVSATPTEQGFTIRTIGDHPYQVEEVMGLMLVCRHHKNDSAGLIRGLPDPSW